ncbi:MAG: SH3 domain-containing protein [Candidatus Viridilinea halotolerans]|uniref:SH3 domain-containing protein n=1 Tax=Candidatus Viridilinea halotolerans TaxID=2491704 RepID=A0A426TW82_9CHLR|nr:MAG: SH3 domain-containing protein [Candidatus Viridilinea halotolerans]
MPSNSEMFERGGYDAEHDELNPFYYQHYYFYRRGYDQARRQVRGQADPRVLMAVATLLLLALLGVGGWFIFGWLNASQAAETVMAPSVPTPPPAAATPRPTATPTPVPAASEAVLRIDGQALVVNLNGVPLRVRRNPGLTPELARLREGTTVTLREGPVEADDYTWWRVEYANVSGWVAAASAEGLPFLEPLP